MSLPALLIPIENQVREMDAKFLLAWMAAQQKFPVYFGWKTEIENTLYQFPKGIYLAKSFAPQNLKVLKLLKGLGHTVVAWDEEGLVHYPPQVYWGRRITPEVLPYLDHIIAWGNDYIELLETYQKPFPVPISNLGNPRGDCLRPDFRSLYNTPIQEMKKQYGEFILINTNFPSVNSFDPTLQLAQRNPDNQRLTMARGSHGMPTEFAKDRFEYKYRLFQAFLEMVGALATKFPHTTIILRPHPSEDMTPWTEITQKHSNVLVENRGSVIPWILASTVLIHNGCTTGVEGVAVGKPVLWYQPFQPEEFESNLPNQLSVRCDSFQALVESIKTAQQNPDLLTLKDSKVKLANFLTAMEGPFDSERIVQLLLNIAQAPLPTQRTAFKHIGFLLKSMHRHFKKSRQQKTGALRYHKDFQEQRFPKVHLSDLEDKMEIFKNIFTLANPINISVIKKNVFKIIASS